MEYIAWYTDSDADHQEELMKNKLIKESAATVEDLVGSSQVHQIWLCRVFTVPSIKQKGNLNFILDH